MDNNMRRPEDEKKVLVTGATGFLGAYILQELLQKGYAVRALRRSQQSPFFLPPAAAAAVEWVEGDILDIVSLEEAMVGTRLVVHAAAMVSFDPGQRKDMYRTNIDGTINVVDCALQQEVEKLVYISSVAALGRPDSGQIVEETDPWDAVKPDTHYAASKYQAEMQVWRAMAEGLRAVILNPSTILGYGDWNKGSCAIFKSVYQSFPWYTKGITGFVDVRDVARAVGLILQSNLVDQRFIISAENRSFRELFNGIADGFSKKRPRREATALLAALAWRWEAVKSRFSGNQSILTRETARLAQAETIYRSNRIFDLLPGFRFTALDDTVRLACAAYLQGRPPG